MKLLTVKPENVGEEVVENLPTEPEIREYVARWSRGGVLRPRSVSSKIKINDVSSCPCFRIRLKAQFLEATEVTRTEPGPVKTGEPSETLEFLTNFTDAIVESRVAGSETTETCASCKGSRTTRCSRCGGAGRITCGRCGGSGQISQPQRRPSFDPINRRTVMRSVMTMVPCGSCMGGRINCMTCMGRGHVMCNSCHGTGETHSFRVLVRHYKAEEFVEFVNTTGIPNASLGNVSGMVALQERWEKDQDTPEIPRFQANVQHLLGDAANREHGDTLFHEVVVEQVPIYQIDYGLSGSKGSRLWIYGQEHSVYAPEIPKSFTRLGIAIGIAGLLVLVIFFVSQMK